MTHDTFMQKLPSLTHIDTAEHPRILSLSLALTPEKRAALYQVLVKMNEDQEKMADEDSRIALQEMEKIIMEAEHKIATAERAMRHDDEHATQEGDLATAEAAINAL